MINRYAHMERAAAAVATAALPGRAGHECAPGKLTPDAEVGRYIRSVKGAEEQQGADKDEGRAEDKADDG